MDRKEFLNELVHVARRYGHDGDYSEIRDFVKWTFEYFREKPPTDEELEPMKYSDMPMPEL